MAEVRFLAKAGILLFNIMSIQTLEPTQHENDNSRLLLGAK